MKRILLAAILFSGFAWSAGAQQVKPLPAPGADTTIRKPLPVTAVSLKPAPFRYSYYQSLGAACKAELKLEKATGVPFRFRLGSLQQTDYLERKPNAVKPER